MLNENPHVKELKEKLYDVSSSEKPQKRKITLSSDELVKRAKEVRKTFKDEDLARFCIT